MRVTASGRPGVITSGKGAYIRIRLDGEKRAGLYHPTWQIVYHTPEGDFVPEAGTPWLGRGDEMWGKANRG
jgi:hypothetical protein